MNNKLPEYFSFVKPVLPTATERYEMRNPSFHTPAIKHKFAECSLQYCLDKSAELGKLLCSVNR